MFAINEIEKIIGYTFKDKQLLTNCFTHSSYANENKGCESNERLEFFGDSILGFVVTEYLYLNKMYDEGKLTQLKQGIVSKTPLSKVIISLGLNNYMRLGIGLKQLDNQININISENLFEAIVAGIYLDGGIENTKTFIFDKLIKNLEIETLSDYKSQFQEIVQAKKLGIIEYKVMYVLGTQNAPTFNVQLLLNQKVVGIGSGQSKRKAEAQAAKQAIENLGVK